MTDLRKAAEALIEHWEAGEYKNCTGYMTGHVATLRQALVHDALDRMVAENQRLGLYDDFDSVGCGTIYKTAGEDRVPLYSAPKRWVGLTDGEMVDLLKEYEGRLWSDVSRAIEAKLKEKNT